MQERKSVFHPGEVWVQQRANAAQEANAKRAMITQELSAGAVAFVEAQVLLIMASRDTQGKVWASIASGAPGFVRARDAHTVELQLSAAVLASGDPLRMNCAVGAAVGMLAIEFSSRRRLRMNGRVTEKTADTLSIRLDAAYANCPRYIRRREWRAASPAPALPLPAPATGARLTPAQLAWIRNADTLFVASVHPDHGADASHRGGDTGFVRVVDDATLVVPDYAGNNLFNTLGNFVSYPRAGLLFVDFEHHRVLQLTGGVNLEWERDGATEMTMGGGRRWRFSVDAWREDILPGGLRWHGD